MIKNFLCNKKAFTMMEALVVVSIVGISVLIYAVYGRGNVRSSMLTEAKMFVEKIVAQEKVYYSDRSTFFTFSAKTQKRDELFIDLKENKYFKSFQVTKPSANTVSIQLFPNTENYPDLAGYSVTGNYYTDKDIIKYIEKKS